jgi:hypothetical protein
MHALAGMRFFKMPVQFIYLFIFQWGNLTNKESAQVFLSGNSLSFGLYPTQTESTLGKNVEYSGL